uniref:Uncharacterized protein n=1 Tax=Anguilla anguilla TaxID=7936 RepID=A0A0E9W748_ANGAN
MALKCAYESVSVWKGCLPQSCHIYSGCKWNPELP